ncbi:MAG: 4Fe-4S dicluster domain-containing protein [Candidatus Bipolaricaulota bacterium]
MSTNFPEGLLTPETYRRFDQRRTVFGRITKDENAPFYRQGMYDQVCEAFGNEDGYSRFELARTLGGWAVYDYFSEAFEPQSGHYSNNMMDKPVLKSSTEDPEELTAETKKAARAYGASSVGIAEVDPRWVYSHDRRGDPVELPLQYDYAVVMTAPVHPELTRESPAFPAARASALSYSRMAFLIACLAEFIRRLGCRALPMGNDRVLSIPLAVEAGLGQLGRNGLLLTPDRGPYVKICKVFTDMELLPDDPLDPPLMNYCRNCGLCSEACEVDAISSRKEPNTSTACPSNNEGVVRWAVNHDECYQFWVENGSDCSTCIAACPFTPGSWSSIFFGLQPGSG